MTSKEIKSECQALRDKIVLYKIRIEELQTKCKHENTYEGKWSYRVGSCTDAIICSDCMKKVKNLINIPTGSWTVS